MAAIDPTRYVVVPRATVRRQLALGRVLVKYKPEQASEDVEHAVKALNDTIATLTQAFADRHVEKSSGVGGDDVALDVFVDDVWYVIDERLQHWKAFERPAVQRLAEGQDPEGFDYEAASERAHQAAKLWKQLFSAGLDGLRLPHAEQAEFTRTLWTVIDREGLEPQLSELVGADFVAAARDAQIHYDEMVNAQSARAQGSIVNLRQLAVQLQQSIQKYMFSLLAMNREDDPKIVEQIRRALRPVDAVRERLERERARDRGGEEEAVPAETQADIDEILDEEQAVLEQIGGQPNGPDSELADEQG